MGLIGSTVHGFILDHFAASKSLNRRGLNQVLFGLSGSTNFMFLRKFTVLITLLIGGLIIITTVYADDSVTAPSLNSSYSVVDTATRALLPRELYETPTPLPGSPPAPSPTPVKVGVAENAFEKFKCTISWLISWTGKNFCPKELDLAGQTTNFSNKSGVLINSERPREIQPSPQQKDDRLEDVNTSTTGNKEINNIQTSLGSGQGYYSNNLPNFDEMKITDPNDNLNLNGQTFDKDLRVPDVNIRQGLYYQSYYPPGVEPFKQTAGQ